MDSTNFSDSALEHKFRLCGSILAQGRRLVAAGVHGPMFALLLSRASDILDEVDEIMLRLHLDADHDSFARVATMRRELEDFQLIVEGSAHY